jgi:outer membrane lipoprotein SlyB
MKAFSSPRSLLAASAITLAVTLGGCVNGYGAGNVSAGSVGQSATVYTGSVTSVREVIIKPDNSIIGAASGAVLGGIAGSEIGQGDKAETAGAIGGAVLGGIAGNEAGKALGTRRGYAYIVRFDNGEVKEIVQGADVFIQVGTPVNIIARADGWKVTPR